MRAWASRVTVAAPRLRACALRLSQSLRRSISDAPAVRLERALGVVSNLNSLADVEDFALAAAALSPAAAASGGAAVLGSLPPSVRPLAVVKVGGEVIATPAMLASFAASLRGLREQGLTPVVVHGGGPQLNDELARLGVKPEYIGGALEWQGGAEGGGGRTGP